MFKGSIVALITPFKNNVLDQDKYASLIHHHIKNGTNGVVPAGTTGESPTLDHEEHKKVIEIAVKETDGKIPVIAGTGSNSTSEAIELTLAAKAFGVDGTLQVTPYYNKPNNNGLVQHFSAIADLGVPVVLYNVPGRTSREIPISVVTELAQHANIVSIKEAAGSVDRVRDIIKACNLDILSGDDVLAVPMIKSGACGVISVASNIIPLQVCEMIHFALNNEFNRAEDVHNTWVKLFDDLFIDTNPIPVKAAASMLGLVDEIYRLPLCKMNLELRNQLQKTMKKLGIIV